jgi:hypothetical protein
MRTRHDSPDAIDTAVYAVLHEFFATRLNERWMPTRLVQSHCPGIRPRRLRESLARLTERGHIEPAEERAGNPYTRAHRLVAPLRAESTTTDPPPST